jgi:hypothetical protein
MAAPAVQTSSLRKKIAPCKRGPVAEKIEERSGVSERFPLERLGLPGWLRRFLEGRVDLCITGDRIGLGGALFWLSLLVWTAGAAILHGSLSPVLG